MKLINLSKCLLVLTLVLGFANSLQNENSRKVKNGKFEEIKTSIEKLSKDLKKENLQDSMDEIDKINLIWPYLNKSELTQTIKLLKDLSSGRLDEMIGLISALAQNYDNVRCSNDEFESASPLEETFEKYNTEPFLQEGRHGSCALYSVLFGLTKVESLKQHLNSLVKTKDDTYMIKMNGKCYKFTSQEILTAKSETPLLFPSTHMGVLAIGATLNHIDKNEKGLLWGVDQYNLFNGGKDQLFSNPELITNQMNKKPSNTEINSIFSNDGSYKDLTTDKIYAGEFIASIETNNGGGHNIVAYYDSKNWMLFDNLHRINVEDKPEKKETEKGSESKLSKIKNGFKSLFKNISLNGKGTPKKTKIVGVVNEISELKNYTIRSIKLIGTVNIKSTKKKLISKKK